MAGAIRRLAEAIGYPDTVPEEAFVFTFRVDGYGISASVDAGAVLLRLDLPSAPGDVAAFAEFAAGRILKEEATLAYDAKAGVPFLWRKVPEDANGATLREAFEDFARSCDWWLARAGERGQEPPEMPALVIRP